MTKHTRNRYERGYAKGQSDLIEKLETKYGQADICDECISEIRQTASQFATEERCNAPHAAKSPAGDLAVASESAKAMKSSKTVGKEPISGGENPQDAPENACKHEWGDGHTPDGRIHWQCCVKCMILKPETKPENACERRR